MGRAPGLVPRLAGGVWRLPASLSCPASHTLHHNPRACKLRIPSAAVRRSKLIDPSEGGRPPAHACSLEQGGGLD